MAVGLAATAALYLLTEHHEREDLRWATRIAAESLRADIIADVDFEMTGLMRLALLAARSSFAEQFWKEHAALYIQRRPGCIAVEVLTPAYAQASLVYAPAEQRRNTRLAFGGVPAQLLKAASEGDGPVMSAFVRVDDRSIQRVTVMPLDSKTGPAGFILAFFDVHDSFDGILADVKNLGFSMAVLEGGLEQYRMVTGSNEPGATPESTYAAEVALPGVRWALRVWPDAPTLYAMDANLPELTLIVGALISLLLASTVHFAYNAKAQSRNLRQLTAELRRAHRDLEVRVRQRTTELSAANANLENEIIERARATQALQNLTGQLFQLQDEERRRLARELHDGATQNLVALGMNVASLRTQALSAEQRTELLDDCARMIQQSVGELRTTAHLLHPPLIEELGLPVTLRSYADGFAGRSGIHVALTLDPELGRLNPEVELGIFRVVQESLANIHRHSHSPTANILLCRDDAQIRLEISDEGTGIPPDVLSRTERGMSGVGIAGMRERVRLLGGDFELRSGDTGTTIRIVVPATGANSISSFAKTAGSRDESLQSAGFPG